MNEDNDLPFILIKIPAKLIICIIIDILIRTLRIIQSTFESKFVSLERMNPCLVSFKMYKQSLISEMTMRKYPNIVNKNNTVQYQNIHYTINIHCIFVQR